MPGALTMLLLICPAWAQEEADDDPLSLQLGQPKAAAPSDEFNGLATPDPPENVSLAWQLRQRLLAQGEADRAYRKLAEIDGLRIDLGGADLPLLAHALTGEARTAADKGDAAEAIRLATAAARLAPRDPAPDFALARLHRLGEARWGDALSATMRGIRKTVDHPLRRAWLLGEAALRVTVALLLMFGLFVAVQWVRYARSLAHDLQDGLPAGVSPRQAVALLLLLAAALPLAEVPPAGTVAIWLLALFGYQRRGEQVVSMAAVTMLATLPWTLTALDRTLHVQEGNAARLHRASYEFPSEAIVEELGAALAATPDDPWVLHGLSLVEKRLGRLYEAGGHIERALAVAGPGHPAEGPLLVNKAAILVAQNRLDEAERTYRTAAAAAPGLASAHFGLARALQAQKKDDGEVQAAVARALALDEPRVERFQQHQAEGLNRFVMDEPIPADVVVGLLARTPVPRTFCPAVLPAVFGDLPEEAIPGLGAILFCTMALLASIRSRIRTAGQCAQCAGPVCVRCHPGIGRTGHCHDCYMVFHKAERVDPRDRQRREHLVRRRGARQRAVALALTLVLTGAGHFWAGRALRGAVFLVLFFVATGVVAAWPGVIRPPIPASPGWPVAGWAATAVAFGAVYVLAILDIRVEERS